MTTPHIDGSRQYSNGSGDSSADLVWTARQPGVNGTHLGEHQHTGGGRMVGQSTLRLVWIYADLLSTYGDRVILILLDRRDSLRGLNVEPV
ncbi:MAG: hypothetical protein ACTHKL_03900, partial [Streptosporangiaceae bacterium]